MLQNKNAHTIPSQGESLLRFCTTTLWVAAEDVSATLEGTRIGGVLEAALPDLWASSSRAWYCLQQYGQMMTI
jgi:hypothetical protein